MEEGISYNLRGLNTYNLVKRVIWSSATYRPSGELDEKSEINLPLLKGLLNEIQMELYIEDYLYRSGMRRDGGDYKEIDIYDDKGYDDYRECEEHPAVVEVLSQFSMIDPYKILKTFHSTKKPEVLSKKTRTKKRTNKITANADAANAKPDEDSLGSQIDKIDRDIVNLAAKYQEDMEELMLAKQ